MFIICRKRGQKFVIKEKGRAPITITALTNQSITLGIEAADSVDIVREEATFSRYSHILSRRVKHAEGI
jgi:sRNA-binding carbon storage regulator CsrA